MVFGNGGRYNLDVSGIAGFFGGEESIAAMASVNLVRFRLAVGWYNSPGSYSVAKNYGIIAGTRFWDGVFPGKDSIPATILGLDGKHGPKYIGSKSGTRIDMTGHLAYLLFSYCTDLPTNPQRGISREERKIAERTPVVTPRLTPDPLNTSSQEAQENGPRDEAHQSFTPTSAPPHTRAHEHPSGITQFGNEYSCFLTLVPDLNGTTDPNLEASHIVMTKYLLWMSLRGLLYASLTIGFSVAAAVIAAVKWNDFFSCIAISIGIVCNGFATLVYGSGVLALHTPPPRLNAVPGDGILIRDNHMVILRGPEGKIASITRGYYALEYRPGSPYHLIGWVSFALAFQTISQLILLPAATLQGQIIFLTTLAFSWCYNAYLASIDREHLQFEVLRQRLGLTQDGDNQFRKARFKRWASMVAASAFYLDPTSTDDWLLQLIPNSTRVWDKWREYIVRAVAEHHSPNGNPIFELSQEDVCGWSEVERQHLEEYLKDAEIGYYWCKSI